MSAFEKKHNAEMTLIGVKTQKELNVNSPGYSEAESRVESRQEFPAARNPFE